jgi:hypothetical protein
MLTVTKLGLPPELRRSLACTNIIENVMGTVRRVCRNVKYWRSPSMALRWAGAAMQEAATFARQEPLHRTRILSKPRRLRRFSSDARFALSNIKRDIAGRLAPPRRCARARPPPDRSTALAHWLERPRGGRAHNAGRGHRCASKRTTMALPVASSKLVAMIHLLTV